MSGATGAVVVTIVFTFSGTGPGVLRAPVAPSLHTVMNARSKSVTYDLPPVVITSIPKVDVEIPKGGSRRHLGK